MWSSAMLPAEEDIIATAQFLLEQGNQGKISEQDSENVAWLSEEFLNMQTPIAHPLRPMAWKVIFGPCWEEVDLHELLDPIARDLLLAKENGKLRGVAYMVSTYESIKQALRDRRGWSIMTRIEPYDLHLPEIP